MDSVHGLWTSAGVAGPLWTEIPVVHGPVDPVYGNFFNEINLLIRYFQEFCKEAHMFLRN